MFARNETAEQIKQFLQLVQVGKFREAETLGREQIMPLAQAHSGSNSPKLAPLLYILGNLNYTLSRFKEAESLLLRAKDGFERTAGPGGPQTLGVDVSLASLHTQQGRYGDAETILNRALAESERALGPNSRLTLGALRGLAQLYVLQGRFREAEPIAKRALAGGELAFGADDGDTLMALQVLATVYGAEGRLREAEELLKRKLASQERIYGREHIVAVETMASLASIYSMQGRYNEAEPLAKRALLAFEGSVGKEHIETLEVMGVVARLYFREGRYDEAEALGKRLLDGYERTLGPEHPKALEVVSAFGEFYLDRGRYEEAEEFLKRAVEANGRVYGKESYFTLDAMQRLAALYDATGRYGEAQLPHEYVLSTSDRTLGKDHPLTLSAANYFGNHYLKQGRYGEAAPLLQQALAGSERVYGAGHPETLKTAYSVANLSFAQSDWRQAFEAWRRSTAALVERTGRGAREDSGEDLIGKTKSETERAPQHFQGLLKAAYRLAPEGALAAEMFQAAQWAQGSGAAASMAQMAARGAAGDPGLAALVRERQDLVAEWQKRDGLHDKALSLKPEQRNAKAEEENGARLAAIDARIKEIDKRLAAEFPDYASLASSAPLSVADVQSALGADEALVFFLDTPELKPAPEETFLWIVTKTEIRWLRSELGSAALAREVQALRCGLDAAAWEGEACVTLTGQSYSDADREAGRPLPFDRDRAYKLYRALFGQAEDLIAGKSLLLVPSGPLTQVPFQVLITAEPSGSDDRSAAWLIRSHALSVLPAVSSLKALRRVARPSAASKPMIGFGNPLLDGDQSDAQFGAYFKAAAQRARDSQSCAAPREEMRLALASVPRGVVRLRALHGLADVKLLRIQDPLPETADELCSVARDLQVDANDIYLGARATENEVKRLSASGELARYRVVHFATHGALAGELDRNSEPGLLLTPPAEPSEADDGYLTASEIAGLKLDADWVVLSACNTAAAGAQGAEALSGLARAFIYAQARALLVSHWAVNSVATVRLVTGAMRRIAEDRTIGRAEALRQSMLDLIDKGEPQQAEPAFWAPFVVVGEGGAGR